MQESALESSVGGSYLLIRPTTQTDEDDQSKARCSKITKVVVGMLLFSIVITCTVLSKLSLISLTSQLNDTIGEIRQIELNNSETATAMHNRAAGLFWQLLFIILIPQFVTFFRALFFGVCGKQSRTFPWPTRRAIVTGAVASVFEVAAMTIFVFYVLPRLPSSVAILALGGVFSAQALLDSVYLKWSPFIRHHDYMEVDEHNNSTHPKGWAAAWRKRGARLLENKFSRMISLFLQLASVIVLAVIAALQCDSRDRALVGCGTAFSLLVLGAVWSSKVQQESHRAPKMAERTLGSNVIREREHVLPTAGFKSSFINSSLQIVLYSLITVLLSLVDHDINPLCHNDKCSLSRVFAWTAGTTVSGLSFDTFLIQILSSFFGYAFMWISCTMVLHRWGLALPLYLCTPISVGVCAISVFYKSLLGIPKEPLYEEDIILILISVGLWVGQILGKGLYIWQKRNIILARDTDMFTNPHYDGILLEQQVILNREPEKPKLVKVSEKRKSRSVFVCSTMYREDSDEMKQILSSIYTLARHCAREKEENPDHCDHFESHVFFDGGVNGTQLTHFALQLVSLLQESIKVDPKICQPHSTPYGYMLYWLIEDTIPFCIHLKDNSKIKNKKRWSQVMYMNYVLNYRVKRSNNLDDDNTFILTTDADIQFTPESAIVLLDILDSDPQVGAVCARTHPQGSGPLYWYQVFDYAIGHWFLKVAEHILGTVLCCPGCFSVFRCRALRSVLDTYSTEVTSANEFLTKDMGEDRWLCTLLVEKGWRLLYCAISENYTHCPESMDEFFKQRRRWIPSTVANLSLLISHASQITKGNDRISMLFVVFEAIMVFSTAISPATVMMVIAAGFTSSFGIEPTTTIALLLVFCLLYAAVCLYGDPQLQLDIAQVSTLLFSLLMGVVVVGYVINIEQDIQNVTATILNWTGEGARGPLPTFIQPSTIYLFIYVLVFLVATALHPSEWTCILHFIWYIIALPSGYLVLLIYSAANLDNRSWGTREAASSGGQVGVYKSATRIAEKVWTRAMLCLDQCTCRPVIPPLLPPAMPPLPENCKDPLSAPPLPSLAHEADETCFMQPEAGRADLVDRREFQLTADVHRWLDTLECGQYAQCFEQHGYHTVHLIADMKSEDFDALGISERGHRLRIEREAKRLTSLPIERAIPDDVTDWLQKLELQGYSRLFNACGYSSKEDLESVKGLTMDDLKKMGINKRAHQQRLLQGTKRLAYPSAVEVSISQSKVILENSSKQEVEDEDEEKLFWTGLLRTTLEPMKATFMSDVELKGKLKSLRNTVLCVMLLINLMWIVLILTLKIPISGTYKIPEQTLTLLFLFIYTVVLLIQFLAMIVHRCITLVHYLARVGPQSEADAF